MTFSIAARSVDGTQLGVAVASKFLAVGNAGPGRQGRGRRGRHPGDGQPGVPRPRAGPARRRRRPRSRWSPPSPARTSSASTASSASSQRPGRARPTPVRSASRGPVGAPATGTRCRATSWPGRRSSTRWRPRGSTRRRPTRWSTGCCRRCSPATAPAGTAGDASPRRCSSSRPGAGTAAAATSWWTCGSTTTPTRCPSWSGCASSTSCTSVAPTRRSGSPLRGALADETRDLLTAAGHPPVDDTAESLDAALAAWAGVENLEERLGRGADRPRGPGPAAAPVSGGRDAPGTTSSRSTPAPRASPPCWSPTTAGWRSKGYQEFPQHFPADGWVEHEPDEIWSATLAAVRSALTQAEHEGVPAPVAVGVTNQRETVVLWDRETLGAARPAIVWQDRRTAALCEQLRAAGHEPRVHELHRPAAGPVLLRHQARLAGGARPARPGPGSRPAGSPSARSTPTWSPG